MKKFTLSSLTLLLILLFSFPSKAQLVKFGIGGGLTAINSPDSLTKSISAGGLGFTSNYHFTVMAKLNIPLVPITPGIFIDYHYLKGSGTSTLGNVSTEQNIFSIGVEGQYNILPLPLVKPYAAVDIVYNHFGNLQISEAGYTYTFTGNNRYGAAIGIGALVTALPSIDLDVSLKYNFMNLIGKDSGESSINATTLNLILFF